MNYSYPLNDTNPKVAKAKWVPKNTPRVLCSILSSKASSRIEKRYIDSECSLDMTRNIYYLHH